MNGTSWALSERIDHPPGQSERGCRPVSDPFPLITDK